MTSLVLTPELTAQALTMLGFIALVFEIGAVIKLRQSLYSPDPSVRRRGKRWLIAIALVMSPIVIVLFVGALRIWINGP
jgi:hypothetical protein